MGEGKMGRKPKHKRMTVSDKNYIIVGKSIKKLSGTEFLENITRLYFNLIYETQLIILDGYWLLPDDQANREIWIAKKIKGVQKKIIEKIKEGD